MRHPLISIIIPAYNAAEWVSDALESCVRQRYNAFEVVIVDDGSTDETYVVCSRYTEKSDKPVRILRTANRGSSAARNAGLECAKGEYVLFLDADDTLVEGALDNLGSIASGSEIDAVFGAHSNLDQLSGAETFVPKQLVYRDSYANVARLLWFQGSCLLKKTSLRWNENRVIWEGLEYLLDFLASGRNAAYTNLAVVRARQHQSAGRISCRFDHFEPAMTGAFFAEQKAKLEKCDGLTFERASALDYHILGNAYALLRAGKGKQADRLLEEVSWSEIRKYDWCHVGSLGWAGWWGGPKFGTRGFYFLNRLIGRA